MSVAHAAASELLPDYASKFSRHDFTLAQLFACLVVQQMLGLSYRRVEAVLRDTDWCQRIGMKSVPDHVTLCRAFHRIVSKGNSADLLSMLTDWMKRKGKLGRVLAIDSTLLETHHTSRHYERRRRHQAAAGSGKAADSRRSRTARRTPKLGIGIDTRTHFVLSMKLRRGMGSDAPDFHDLLYDAWRRHDITHVLADAGYDSEANHRLARLDLNVRSLIKTGVGRPTSKPPSGPFRRRMRRQLSGSQAGKPYGQRAQAETTMSMLKRNLGETLRSRSPAGRKRDLMLKVLVHNLMIVRCKRGSQQSPSGPFCFFQNQQYTQTIQGTECVTRI